MGTRTRGAELRQLAIVHATVLLGGLGVIVWFASPVRQLRRLLVAHSTVGVIGAVGIAAPMVPVRRSQLLMFDALGDLVLVGAAVAGVIAGLVEGLLLRLPDREVGEGLGTVVVAAAGFPVAYALWFAHAPWSPTSEPVPVGHLVTALLTWTAYLVCATAAALPTAPRGQDGR